MTAADGDGGISVLVGGEEFFDEGLVYLIVAIDEADEVASGFF